MVWTDSEIKTCSLRHSWTKGWRLIQKIKQNRFLYGMFYSWSFAVFYQKLSQFGFWVDGWSLAIKSKHFRDFNVLSKIVELIVSDDSWQVLTVGDIVSLFIWSVYFLQTRKQILKMLKNIKKWRHYSTSIVKESHWWNFNFT